MVGGVRVIGVASDRLRQLGASAFAAAAFDPKAVRDAIESAAPDAVIDQPASLLANLADIIKPRQR
jgi:hypothetical protein